MLRAPAAATLGLTLLALAASPPAALDSQEPPRSAAEAGATSSLEAEDLVVEGTIPELQEALAGGIVTSAELVEAYLDRIAAYDQGGPVLNSVIRLNPAARAQAEALDRERRESGPRGPLHGIPVLVKDNYDTEDMPTTASTLALSSLVPQQDATQVRLLREAGAIVLGKTNLHELAAGITTVSSFGGQTRNPYDPSRSPGGSSGGTAAAVAASFAAVGWGSDTCGSIRIPAAENNLVGLRPTTGLSSTAGLVPLSRTQDVAGPLARSVIDLALALDATVGPDPADPSTRALDDREIPSFVAALDGDALRGARIGMLEAWISEADGEVVRRVRETFEAMEAAGAEVTPVEFPALDSLLANTGVIDYELKFDLADYLAGIPEAPVSSLGEILDLGLHHEALDERLRHRNQAEERDSAERRERLERQARLREALVALLDDEGLDALAYPTMRGEPAVIGAPPSASACALSAHSGLPALTAPAGFTGSGLPVGIELLGRPFDDARLVAFAYSLEHERPVRRAPIRTPPLENGRSPSPLVFGASAQGWDRASGHPTVPGFRATFSLDLPAGSLSYRVAVSGVPPDEVVALVLQRRGGERARAVVGRLAGPGGASAEGTLSLPAHLLQDLVDGHLFLSLHTRDAPLGAARARLVPRAGRAQSG